MTEQEAIERIMRMKPSWMDDGQGLMGSRKPYTPSDKPKGEVGFRKHELSIDAKADIGESTPTPVCHSAPDGFRLTLSGVSNAACNSSGPTAGAIIPAVSWSPASSVDGVYTLVDDGFTANFAAWQCNIDTAPYKTYTLTACGGTEDDGLPTIRSAHFFCHKGKLSLRITAFDGSAFFGKYPYFFLAQDITIGETVDNELTVADTCTLGQDTEIPTNYVIASATGGTALIEAL